jgi:hypothetical protein
MLIHAKMLFTFSLNKFFVVKFQTIILNNSRCAETSDELPVQSVKFNKIQAQMQTNRLAEGCRKPAQNFE